MRSLDPDYLQSFLAIIDTGSYAAAAEVVHKTQSTVSAQIARIEDALGLSLFEKSGRRNVPTAAGLRLVEYARAIVRLNEEAIAAFRPAAIGGRIRVGTSDDYAQVFFPGIVARFLQSHPGVEVEIEAGGSSSLLQSLNQGALDAVVVSAVPGRKDLQALREDQLHWIGPEHAPIDQREELPLALWPDGCNWRAKALAVLAKAGQPHRIVHTTSNGLLLTSAVREGLGVTVAPRWYVSPGLRVIDRLDRRFPLGKAEIGIKTKRGKNPAVLSEFVDYLRATLSRTPTLAA